MADAAAGSSAWLAIWARAVVGPAWRRAVAVWVGTGIVGAVIFGPTGMRPRDLTELALRDPGVGVAVVATWLLLFVPIARGIVRADAAAYLRTLPGPTRAAAALAIAALTGLQLPWLALWWFGEHARGLVVIALVTAMIAAIARWRPPATRARVPRWASGARALRAIYVRALRRRAGDALLRAGGLAILAGLAGGMLIRNNALVDRDAATIGAAMIALVLVPAQIGALTPLVDTYRATGWLAGSLGIAATTRVATLAAVIGAIYLLGTAIAVVAAAIAFGGDPSTTAWLASVAAATALGSAMVATRLVLWAERSPSVATRTVVGAMVTAAGAMLWLGVVGVVGAAGMLATGALGLLTMPAIEAQP